MSGLMKPVGDMGFDIAVGVCKDLVYLWDLVNYMQRSLQLVKNIRERFPEEL